MVSKVRLATAAAVVAVVGVLAQSGVHPLSGRRFAAVMGAAGADWLERPERVAEENPDRALDVLDIHSGATVADIGAGSGYFTVRLAARVGPSGTVYANDIQPEMLQILTRRLAQERIGNVRLVQGSVDDPR